MTESKEMELIFYLTECKTFQFEIHLVQMLLSTKRKVIIPIFQIKSVDGAGCRWVEC